METKKEKKEPISTKKQNKQTVKKGQKQRKRSRSRSNSLEKEAEMALKEKGWGLITDTSTKNPVIEIATQFKFEGALRLKVKTGCAEVYGREIKANN